MAQSPVETASFVPVGVTYHLLPNDRTIDQDSVWQEISYRNLDQPTAQDLGSAYIEAEYNMFRALNEFRLGRSEEALRLLAQAAELAHGLKECLNNIGSMAADYGFTDQAIPYFEQARRLDKRYVMPRWNLFRTFQRQEKWEECEPLLAEILAAKPDDPQVYRELGFFMRDVRGDPRAARHHFEKSLKENPAQPDVLRALLDLIESSHPPP
jgi:tetratricopeptide (TPR) repeat protein